MLGICTLKVDLVRLEEVESFASFVSALLKGRRRVARDSSYRICCVISAEYDSEAEVSFSGDNGSILYAEFLILCIEEIEV